MGYKLVVLISALTLLSSVQLAPVLEDDPQNKVEENTLNAFSKSNATYSTFDQIMGEIAVRKAAEMDKNEGNSEHTINKRALGCAMTSVAYGGTTGSAFSEFTTVHPWPCGVDIINITIKHGYLIDSIQMTYQTVDQQIITGERRGGGGGRESTIQLDSGERITGVTGMVCNIAGVSSPKYRGSKLVTQLIFFSQKQDGQKVAHGPYGSGSKDLWHSSCQVFAVNGKINSIFGRIFTRPNPFFVALESIGFYYEDESGLSQNTK